MKFLPLFACFFFSACTVSVIQTHTEGVASDVVDSIPTNDPQVSPVFDLPVVG